mmetsp:Transcript_8756/g.12007  ORF Transcript_8756/g.12007 Transcript_8756/m.12007 type:complete len:114 (+) Transcript_8756:398-739(+)|eukprot:CAMPEP_0185581656 /NCGR_PEP_ID=MMETSP0434-20130131/18645_1 /TAXON_ID=626734 ORGANISM="Favella taraikaensis, Strain Fe Narragansett Bay" /NCGR_SAMPLE_ID=MMETSP0434 /ASSEMBLY_ACC=CAM_ASM_000379 /LENGTH=113 /DNA_ID=CAMNT_0028200247 /DNA_START=336 /DNA_END=677 /DNA_ORIENTATION=-
MLEAKTGDQAQRVRVMRRVKLMLDPQGSTIGKTMPPDSFDSMTEEQKQAYEAEQVMRGLGHKCMRKGLESLLMAAVMMLVMYYTGFIDQFLLYMNPHLAKRHAVEEAVKGAHA